MKGSGANAGQPPIGAPQRQESDGEPKLTARRRTRGRDRVRSHGLDGGLRDQQVDWVAPGRLRPHAQNARTHSDRQIEQIAASIRTFDFVNPILVDADGRIIAGHGRVEAAKRLGLERVPVLRIEHLSEAEIRAYVIADNRLAELAGWDSDLLAIELQQLTELELDFEVEITGFATAEIDLLIDGRNGQGITDQEEEPLPLVADGLTVSRLGDLWRLGPHRVMCGNALDPEAYDRLLDGDQVRMVFTDPPYNVPVNGHVGGLGQIQHREFVMASGEMSASEFTAFLTRSLTNMAERCVNGALLYVCMDWRHLREVLGAGESADLDLINLCVWVKDNGGMGSFYRSRHELVCVFKSGTAPHLNTVELGRHGRYRTNVWEYPGVNTLRRGRLDELALHPTVKPTALVADAIRDCTRRSDIVLDPFAGSGTTIIAAERTGRIARVMELDPAYVDVAVRRWESWSGEAAVHVATGKTFAELAESREESLNTPPRRIRHRARRPDHVG